MKQAFEAIIILAALGCAFAVAWFGWTPPPRLVAFAAFFAFAIACALAAIKADPR